MTLIHLNRSKSMDQNELAPVLTVFFYFHLQICPSEMINHRTILSGVLVALTWQWPIEKYSCRNQEKSENEKNDHSNKVILKLVVVKGGPRLE